jgi:outer membrane protein assembly factor BamB/ABC-type phosphate/phosphonate transport system substrate-binding protein
MSRLVALILAAWLGAGSAFAKPKEPVTLVVMDPLAKELACACVKGFGQRDYRKLAARLEKAIKKPVKIEFSDDLAETLEGSAGRAATSPEIVVIGDQSLVANGAKKAGLKSHPVCDLTDVDGNTTLPALFIVRSGDAAKELKDLAGRKILFGVADADEKHAAALSALRDAGAEPGTTEQRGSFSDAALDVLDSQSSPAPVAVVPGYAMRLLEGCGSVKPGSLRVIGKARAVPFITVFVSDSIPAEKEEKLVTSLLSIKSDAKFLNAMESRDGFIPCKGKDSAGPRAGADSGPVLRSLASVALLAKEGAFDEGGWPDWRGPNRDGHVAQLPARLPSTPKFLWKKGGMNGSIAGLSISGKRVILAERDFADEKDLYRCLDANNGELLWLAQFSAPGKLDYGQSPRATPVIHAGKAYLLGAFGDLRCVNLNDGKLIWQRHLPREFKAQLPTWGMCCTPLIIDDELVVNPGSTNASLVALDLATGRTLWTSPGSAAAYSAFICGDFGGRRQIVGYDRQSLGGWDVKTGQRLWKLVPPVEGDFNVPTPIAVDGGILVSTENNGTRLYRFDNSGRIVSKPAAEFRDLAPNTATPVVTHDRVFGASSGLHCLDIRNGLKELWHTDVESLGEHASFIADNERVLVLTYGGELLLLDARADTCSIISRMRLFDDDVELYSHPALVGQRLYARGGSSVVCVDLSVN